MVDDPGDELPDLARGVAEESIAEGGTLVGCVGDEKVIVFRRGAALHAFGATCPHLGGPLAEGLVADGTIRCPWHHACFDITTGAALSAPAFDALPRYTARRQSGLLIVTRPAGLDASPMPAVIGRAETKGAMMIIGAGAAGFAAADSLRKLGFPGTIEMISADAAPPYDCTLLKKDYLDGHFGDDRLPIARHSAADLKVRLALDTRVESIDIEGKAMRLSDGRSPSYKKLLLATGAEPRKPDLPGIDLPHVHLLRTLADCRGVLAALPRAGRIAVVGGSFIGLEAAASLRSRGFAVDLVTPETRPLEGAFGPSLSDLIVDTHRRNGVALHLGRKIDHIGSAAILLDDGGEIPADLILVGIGVAPRTKLAEDAGLALDRGVRVDAHLRTSAPDVFAAGDIARWPDPHSGEAIRVEHWVVAERQGQVAAANMLGADRAFDSVPFFWTEHFDLSIRYVGHAENWDELVVDGEPAERDALVRYRKAGRDAAIATVGRDLESLKAEHEMESRLAQARPARAPA